jgi:hypothetical protein
MQLVAVLCGVSGGIPVLTPLGSSLGLRDACLPKGTPASQCMRYFPVSATTDAHVVAQTLDLGFNDELVTSVLDGFNRCVVSFGERGAGKTILLHGSRGADTTDVSLSGPTCVAEALLASLFLELSSRRQVQAYSISLSVWAVQGNRVLDLCTDGERNSRAETQHTLVECPTLSIAVKVLRVARDRCPGLSRGAEAERAHSFTQILVHQRLAGERLEGGQAASLFLVDLVGAASTSGADFTRLPEVDRISRRITALHLQTLAKCLSQLRNISQRAKSASPLDHNSPVQLTAARDSALTSVLCPILQGNAATTFVMFLRDSEGHFAATKRTLVALEQVPEIASACFAASGVRLSDLPLRDFSTILGPPVAEPLAGADLDLERLAYGFRQSSRRRSTTGRDGDDWDAKLFHLVGEFQNVMAHSEERVADRSYSDWTREDSFQRSQEVIPSEDQSIPEEGVIELGRNAPVPTTAPRDQSEARRSFLSSSSSGGLQLANEALLEERQRLEGLVRDLREQLGGRFFVNC